MTAIYQDKLNHAFSRRWEGLPNICSEAGISVRQFLSEGISEVYNNQTNQVIDQFNSQNDAIAAAFLIACEMKNLNPADYGFTFA